MDNANNIFERKNLDGSVDYVVNMGNFLHNDRVLSLSNMVIPIRLQTFFILPDEKRYYAAVNVYYSVDDGVFIFDTIKKSPLFIDSCDSDAITNVVPIGQFILQQSLSSFEVKKITLYSKMSTFTITADFVTGDRGAQGEVGATGFIGYTGFDGYTGADGLMGVTGLQGETCVGMLGDTGLQGATGIYHDLSLLLHLKYKNDGEYLVDYSPYERDLLWGASGAGLTGMILDTESGPSTVIEIIDQGQSTYTLEEGIVDNCHSVLYKGGGSGYTSDRYLGFTGVVQTWVNVSQPPIADFIYEVVSSIPSYSIRFMDASLYNPNDLKWDIDGTVYHSGIVTHSFGYTGPQIVKLTATNFAGSHVKSELITVE